MRSIHTFYGANGILTTTDYRTEVIRTLGTHEGNYKTMLNIGALGLSGEAGEVTDIIKKILFHGEELNRTQLVSELGDVRWYMETIMAAIGTDIEEIEAFNINKIRARYPNGFNTTDANARADEGSRD